MKLIRMFSLFQMHAIALSNVISCLIGQIKDEGNILLTEVRLVFRLFS